MNERLQKILARAGFGSRRTAEGIIVAGRVTVNGAVISELGAQADAQTDVITVDGTAIKLEDLEDAVVYFAMHKPARYVTTAHDPQNRRTVLDLLPPDLPPHVLPVGRLDRDTEGLLIFTNDGEFAHRLAHPRFEIEKDYLARVDGVPTQQALARLRTGVDIDGARTAPAEVDVARPPYGFDAHDGSTWIRLVIHEGRKRQVRKMCEAVGHPVRTLVRTRIGPVTLGRLPRGKSRPLSDREVSILMRATRLDVARGSMPRNTAR